MVIFIIGLPGSGKSHFAQSLSERIDAAYISSDLLRRNLFPTPTYENHEKNTVYEHMLEQMLRITRVGKDIVVDATFFKNEFREKFFSVLDARKVKYKIIEIKANKSDIKKRLSRERESSDADYDVYLKIKKNWEPVVQERITLNSSRQSIDSMLKKAEEYMLKWQMMM